MRAPNKILHTKQDTTHFLFFDGNTIEADKKNFTMSWRPTDHKSRQLEYLKQQKLISRSGQLIGVEAKCLIGHDTYLHSLYRCRQTRKPACSEQNDRRSPTSGRLLVDDRSSCRCSCTKDWYSARHASTSLPLVQPFSRSPFKSLLKVGKERGHPHQLQLQGRSSSNPVL